MKRDTRTRNQVAAAWMAWGLLAGLLVAGCGYRTPLYSSYVPQVTDTTACPGVRAAYQPLAELMRKDTGFGPTVGNTITLLPDGPQKLARLREDVRLARKSIYIDLYRFRVDSSGRILADLLREQSRSGTDVRVLLDYNANEREQREALAGLLADSVTLAFSRPSEHRNHRKLMLLDGQTAYLGGRNVQDHYFWKWRDSDVRITGAAVADLAAVYMESQRRVAPELGPVDVAEDLESAARADTMALENRFTDVTVQIVPDSPTDRILPVRNCYEWALNNARSYFWFYNPYTPPPRSTIKALKDAVARGVDVRWIVPADNDITVEKWMGESLYRELLEAGVRIYEWQDAMMHAKQFMTDDYLMGVGSANMDNLSFFVHYEVEALVYDEPATRHAARLFLSDLETHCREITLGEVRRWSLLRRFRNWITRSLGGPYGWLEQEGPTAGRRTGSSS